METKQIADSLFYAGGTITSGDIIQTSDKCSYNIALNNNYMFIFKKGSTKVVKVVKVEYQAEFTYKIMKSKVKISRDFAKHVQDDLFSFLTRNALNNIINITKGV